jgi:hypothetical protein
MGAGYTKDEFMGMFMGMAGMTPPGEKFICPKCKTEMVRVNSGQAFDFQKMFYCKNKSCKQYGLVTVVAIRQK